MNIDMYAAALEADQANRDFMHAWLNEGRKLDDPYVNDLRYYRGAAERVHDGMLDEIIDSISEDIPEDVDMAGPAHLDYPHWPGYLVGCEACEIQMQAEAEREYDTREYNTVDPVTGYSIERTYWYEGGQS